MQYQMIDPAEGHNRLLVIVHYREPPVPVINNNVQHCVVCMYLVLDVHNSVYRCWYRY